MSIIGNRLKSNSPLESCSTITIRRSYIFSARMQKIKRRYCWRTGWKRSSNCWRTANAWKTCRSRSPPTSRLNRITTQAEQSVQGLGRHELLTYGKQAPEFWGSVETRLSKIVIDSIACKDQFSIDFLASWDVRISKAYEGVSLKAIPYNVIPSRPW